MLLFVLMDLNKHPYKHHAVTSLEVASVSNNCNIVVMSQNFTNTAVTFVTDDINV